MKVNELIKELEKMPQNMEVEYSLQNGWGDTEEVTSVEVKDNSGTTINGHPMPNVVLLF